MKIETVKLINWHNEWASSIRLYILNIDGIEYNYSYPIVSDIPFQPHTNLESRAYTIKPGDTGYTYNKQRIMYSLPGVLPMNMENPKHTIKQFFHMLLLQ